MSLVRRVLLTLATVALYALSFPPAGHPVLAWIALVPSLLALEGASGRTALALGWLCAMGVAWAITDFLPRAVTTYYAQTALFGAVLFVVVVSLMCCPSHMVFSWWYRSRRRPRGAVAPLVVAAVWVLAELARTRLGGNPWGTFAYTQARVPLLLQIAEATGVYGVSFTIVAVNVAIAELLLAVRSPTRRRGALGAGVLAAGTCALVMVHGRLRLSDAAADAGSAGGVRVAVVQGNIDLGSQWRPELYGANLAEYLRLTARAMREARPAMIVWPENAMTFFLEDEPPYRTAIARVLALGGVELVAGGPSKTGGEDAPRYFNSTFVLSPAGEIGARYDKQVLVPFAEYFPFASIAFLNRRFGAVRQFTSGGPPVLLPTVAGRAAVVTCNEVLFPNVVADRVRAGGQYLINLANDAWLADRSYSERMLDIVVVRAVEQRRWVVRAAASGSSAVIDPWGRIVARMEPLQKGSIAADVRPSDAITPYGRVGDAFAVLCGIVVAWQSLAWRRRPERVQDVDPSSGSRGPRATP